LSEAVAETLIVADRVELPAGLPYDRVADRGHQHPIRHDDGEEK